MPIARDYVQPVANLREFLRDYKEDNALTDLEENTDNQLQLSLSDALDYINTAYPPVTLYTIIDIPSWTVVRDRAVLSIIQSNMIKSARNLHSYTDQGGVDIREEDVYGRYVNLYNVLLAKNELHIQRFKTATNVDGGYGGVESEYIYEYNDWY